MTSQPSRKKISKLLGLTAGQLAGLDALSTVELASIDGVTPGTIAAGKAVIVDANKDASSFRNITATGTATFGTIASTGINSTQTFVSSAAVTKNASVAFSTVTGLTATVVPGTYTFRAVLPSTVASGTGGIQYAFNYTGTVLTSLEATGLGYTSAAVAVQHTTTITNQTALFNQAAVVIMTILEGSMVVATGGTIDVQVAQSVSNASNTVALVGGSFELTRIA